MPVESRISVNDVEIALWEWPGEGTPVFFCHATGFHSRCWDRVIEGLPGRRCLAIDVRGHGHSSKPDPPYLWRNFGSDVARITERLGLEGAIAVGHSMGGHAVTLAAALRPSAFSSLLLIDPVIRAKGTYVGPWTQAQFVAKRRNRWASAQEMFERFESRQPFDTWDRGVLRDYCAYGLLPDGNEYVLACPPAIEAGIYQNSPAPESDIYAEIATIEIPVQVVRAAKPVDPANVMSQSPTTPDLVSYFARGKDLSLPDNTHFIPMEAPALISELIRGQSTGR